MSKPDFIVFAEDWQRHPSSSQHLFEQLGQQHRVLWVNSIGLRRPGWADLGRLWHKLTAVLKREQRQPDQSGPVQVLAPLAIPVPRSRWARALNRALLRWQVRRKARAMGLHRPWLWLALPTAVDLVGQLGEAGTLYYCGDDFSALAGVDHQVVARREQELASKADRILVASEALAAKFASHWQHKTQLLPHGVALAHFQTPAEVDPCLQGASPVAGFYGSVAEWLDQEMLLEAARRLPHWRFVLVGRVETDVSRLQAQTNIELMPPVPHSALPSLVQHWQASLLPFRDNAQIRACNPLKLREYLAAGTPVISTDFPALKPFMPWLTRVRDGAQLAEALTNLAQLPQPKGQELQDSLQAQSWQQRAEQVLACVAQLNQRKGSMAESKPGPALGPELAG
ncbi:glycosyltransferase [Ferrimonas marina]|uniref:Glycosyltransferase involved in cell wall bisynthesis n=1 Tax=Ferrimonas marina TaxID=299255 RepID=A0A1M5RRM7_9GAMM|nr:glycosyltransferase [Ferrimonas marina]SHH28972.1 Glycosyltransferase involved in cell wall bisynthesis [Ferrimonas marina]